MKRYIGGLLVLSLAVNWYAKNALVQLKKQPVIALAQKASIAKPKRGSFCKIA